MNAATQFMNFLLPELEGQAHLSELLGEVSHALTAHGDVYEHPMMRAAVTNGERFLVDTAVMTADAASVDGLPAAEFERFALESVQLILMGVIARRRNDAAEIDSADSGTPPTLAGGAALIDQLAALESLPAGHYLAIRLVA